jgi:23S rRNA (cytidine1920-2'-O)/16S rRNA (cytidine1409-2'-O)-methyltransferase
VSPARPKPERKRLDVLLVERGLAESREKARAVILAGEVRVGGEKVDKAAALVPVDAELVCSRSQDSYASRGGLKLAHALDVFAIPVEGRVALDAGASTGGFTDVLLRRGAARVYAVDVGYGQLDWRLRNDPRVTLMERTNVRYVHELPERVGLVTADLSFISLTLVLDVLVRLAAEGADFVLLVKPQFEAGRGEVGKNGVVRDPATHRAVLLKVIGHAQTLGLQLAGLTASPLLGPAGNVEFLAWCRAGSGSATDVGTAIARALEAAERVRTGQEVLE